MKKLMKAIAFATVMCMLLSVSAFAAAGLTGTDYVVNVTVETNAQASEQVALLIVAANAEIADDTIAYIDQKASALEGEKYVADFGNITISKDFDTVDVYAGFASATNGEKVLVGEDIALESVKDITVSVANREVFDAVMSEAKDAVGAAVGMEVTFNNLGDKTLKSVIWAFQPVSGNRVYSSPVDVDWTGLTGPIKIGAAVNNGVGGVPTMDIESADVIFLFVDSENNEYEAFTNPDVDNTDEAREN